VKLKKVVERSATSKFKASDDCEPIMTLSAMGPKWAKTSETSVKYDNSQREMIENARTGKVN
jgi:hypothetical protein